MNRLSYLDLTLDLPEANLALDEALLESVEAAPEGPEWLRIWEMPSPVVVVGRSTKVHQEVNLPACQRRGIPVLRRCSGGTSVVVGPGCLLYSVVLSYQQRPELRHLDVAHRFVMSAFSQPSTLLYRRRSKAFAIWRSKAKSARVTASAARERRYCITVLCSTTFLCP